MLLGIFNTTLDGKLFTDRLDKVVGDRILVLGMEQTTYEWDGKQWMNINGLHIIGPKGEDGLDGKNGKHAKEVDLVVLFNKLYETLKSDQIFINKCKGERGESIKGEPGKDGQDFTPKMDDIIDILLSKLLNNESFMKSCKGQPGKNGYSPIKGVDYFDGKDGIGKNGKNGIDGDDGRKLIFIDDPDNVSIHEKELGIDMSKNLYIFRNGTILKL